MRKVQTISLIVVGIIIVAAAGIYFATTENDDPGEKEKTGNDGLGDEEKTITITDSLGNEVEIELPVKKVCLTNTNAAKFMQILGVADLVTAADETTISLLPEIYGDVKDLGEYKSPDGETILSTGSKILICQSSARSITNSEELESQGIQIVRLDCYGETMLTDLEQLVAIFGSSTQERADKYTQIYNGVVDSVLGLDSGSDEKPVFMFMFLSLKKPYAVTSELSKITESIGATNCIGILDPDTTGSTSKIQAESILDYDNEHGIDRILIRGTIDGVSTAQSEYSKFLDINTLYEDLNAISAGNVYVIDTDVLSGPLDYVGYVCIAEALGYETGELSAAKLVQDFNDEFGFTYDKTEFVFKIDMASS